MVYILYALAAAFFAALVAIFAKIGLKDVDPTVATMIRVLVMATFFTVVTLILDKWRLVTQIENTALYWIVLSGIAGALSWFFYFLALKYGPATVVAGVDRTSVAMVLILSVIFLGEALTWQTGVGALLVALGAIVMTLK